MHGIVKAFGVILFVIGVIASLLSTRIGNRWLPLLTIGLPLVGTGAILFCFGTIVEHLAAIRKDQKRAADAIKAIWQRRQLSP